MKRYPKVMIICGCGAGSSIMLKANVDSVLRKENLRADLEVGDMLSGSSLEGDILLIAPDVLRGMGDRVYNNFSEVIEIDNFMSEEEIKSKLIPKLKKVIGEED